MTTCPRCGEGRLVKVILTTKDNKDIWNYECKKCGLAWAVK